MAEQIHALREALSEAGLLPSGATDDYDAAWAVQTALVKRGYSVRPALRRLQPCGRFHPDSEAVPGCGCIAERPENHLHGFPGMVTRPRGGERQVGTITHGGPNQYRCDSCRGSGRAADDRKCEDCGGWGWFADGPRAVTTPVQACRYVEEMVGSAFSPSGDTMYRPKCSCGWTAGLQFFGSWAYDEWEKHADAPLTGGSPPNPDRASIHSAKSREVGG